MKTKTIFSAFILLFSFYFVANAQVKGTDIIKQIDNGEDITYNNVEIIGVLDFNSIEDKVIEKGDSRNSTTRYISNIKSKIKFENCTFKGEVIAYIPDDDNWNRNNEIYIANFLEDVIFKDCVFEEEANFKYTEFSDVADFSGTEFEELAFFKYSEFPEEPNFSNVTFNGEAFFKYTEFPRGANFSGAKFEREANFKYTEFPGGVNFQEAEFYRLANFKYAKFYEPFNLEKAEFNDDVDLKYAKVDGKSMNLYLLKNRK